MNVSDYVINVNVNGTTYRCRVARCYGKLAGDVSQINKWCHIWMCRILSYICVLTKTKYRCRKMRRYDALAGKHVWVSLGDIMHMHLDETQVPTDTEWRLVTAHWRESTRMSASGWVIHINVDAEQIPMHKGALEGDHGALPAEHTYERGGLCRKHACWQRQHTDTAYCVEWRTGGRSFTHKWVMSHATLAIRNCGCAVLG